MRNTEIYDENRAAWSEINKNVAIKLGEEYKTVTEYFKESVSSLFNDPEYKRTRKLYSLQKMEECVATGVPNNIMYIGLKCIGFGEMELYLMLFTNIFDGLMKKLDDVDFLDEVFNLCKRFPVENNEDYNKIFMRQNHLDTLPHIELEYESFGSKCKSVGCAHLGILAAYDTTTVLVRFVNVYIEEYTVSIDVINNEYADWSSYDMRKYVDVEWGEWVESDAIELKITKNNSINSGILNLKLYVKENPEICAFIL